MSNEYCFLAMSFSATVTGQLPLGIVQQGSCPRGNFPQGSCPRGSRPRGSCPRTSATYYNSHNKAVTLYYIILYP